MSRLLFVLILFCVLGLGANAQGYESAFARYLLNQHQNEEAMVYLKQHQDGPQSDSVNLLLGGLYFTNKDMAQAISCFEKVKTGAVIYRQALLYLSIAYTYSARLSAADSILGLFVANSVQEADMKNCMLSIVALCDGNVVRYRQLDSLIQDSGFWYADTRQHIKNVLLPLVAKRERKAWKAGVLSALIPGAGKWYGGRPYDGLATFLQTTAIGAIAAEGYWNAGVESVRFIVGASVYAVFYAGNIFGSINAVKVKQEQNKKRIQDEAVHHMHIIVRNYLG